MTMRFEFSRFMDRFSSDDLDIVWTHGGLGELTGDPEAPFPGRQAMVRFLVPIPGSWRDILRRAVRTMAIRRDIAALRALLIAVGLALPDAGPSPCADSGRPDLSTPPHTDHPDARVPVGTPRRRGPDLM